MNKLLSHIVAILMSTAFFMGMCLCFQIAQQTPVTAYAESTQSEAAELLDAAAEELGSTDTVTLLQGQIEEYAAMLEYAADESEVAALNRLIENTQRLIDGCGGTSSQAETTTAVADTGTAVLLAVSDLVAAFIQCSYKLSAELLTYAIGNDGATVYTPVYGSRVISSSVTEEIANGSTISGTGEYPFNSGDARNCIDLFFSIHGFQYAKTDADSMEISIADTYDFEAQILDFSETDGIADVIKEILVTLANNAGYLAQLTGILTPYDIRIDVDMSEPLGIKVLSKTDDTYRVRLTNNTDSERQVVYNEKLCFENDAREWTGLTDITTTATIAAGKSKTVSVSENLLATDMAFSYMVDSVRVVTFAADVSIGNSLSDGLSSEISKITYDTFNCVEVVGKNDDTWLINATNIFGKAMYLQYNTRMCFKGDAQDWDGLDEDLSVKTSLAAGGTKSIRITENGTAGYITMRFTDSDTQITVYANELSSDCSRTLYGIVEIAEDYEAGADEFAGAFLTLTNSGKSSGTWTIKAYNPTDSKVTAYYNTKMCYASDAQTWSADLSNISSFTLKSGASRSVSIKTNLLATAVAFSYVSEDGLRLITYADGLTSSGGINMMYSFVEG